MDFHFNSQQKQVGSNRHYYCFVCNCFVEYVSNVDNFFFVPVFWVDKKGAGK